MSVLAPPQPPRHDDPELLIREARERQRRRRIRIALALAGLAAAAAAAYGIASAVGGGTATETRGPGPFAAVSAFSGHGRLAFVSRGRLYVLDGDTRRLVAVTAGAGASAPAFSPDGRWLAYGYRGRLGIARADGTDPHTLRMAGGAWLPNGELLAGRAIYRIAVDGTPARVAAAPAGLDAWAPDGSRYAFVVSRGGRNGVELLQTASSLTGPRTTWYRVPQSFTPSSGYRSPALGSVVVLPRGQGLLVWLDPVHSASLAADGLPVYELTAPGAVPRKLGTTVGAEFSVGAGGRIALGAGFDRVAWVHKTVVTCTTRCRPVRGAGPLTLDPAWSPHGRTLAYVGAAAEPEDEAYIPPTMRRWYTTRRLWLLTGRVAHPVPATTGAAAPTWSRDGKSLLFVARDSLWLLPRLDARPVRVAGPLFGRRVWPNYYGHVGWTTQFAWQS